MGTISKALEMLDLFSRSRPEIGLGEFVRLTGRDKATVHRHLVELQAKGFLEQNPDSRAYRLGPAILRLYDVREATNPLRETLRTVVGRLAREVGELAHASLLQGDVLSPVVHADPMLHRTRVHFDGSELLPLHATASGLAVLAYADAALAERILSGSLRAFTPSTVTDPAVLRRLIAAVRATGTSRIERAFDEEVTSQGAPVFNSSGKAIGALSVALPTVRATEEKLRAIQQALLGAAALATHSLGGSLPEDFPKPKQRIAAN